jgi:hypothetical protein
MVIVPLERIAESEDDLLARIIHEGS